MKSGYDNPEEHHTATSTKENEKPAAKRKRKFWWKEENWPRLHKYLERLSNPTSDGECGEGYLELREYHIP